MKAITHLYCSEIELGLQLYPTISTTLRIQSLFGVCKRKYTLVSISYNQTFWKLRCKLYTVYIFMSGDEVWFFKSVWSVCPFRVSLSVCTERMFQDYFRHCHINFPMSVTCVTVSCQIFKACNHRRSACPDRCSNFFLLTSLQYEEHSFLKKVNICSWSEVLYPFWNQEFCYHLYRIPG